MTSSLSVTRHQIREVLRENPDLCDQLLEEGAFQDVWSWLKKKSTQARDEFKKALSNLRNEWAETKAAAAIVGKIVSGKKVSAEEKKALSTQTLDIIKGTPLAGLFIMPGGVLAVTAIIQIAKKLGIDMRPSSFR